MVTDECMNEFRWMDEKLNARMDEWMDGWMDGWIKGWRRSGNLFGVRWLFRFV